MSKILGFAMLLSFAAAPAAAQSTVMVNPASIGPAVTSQILGMNMGNFWPSTQNGVESALAASGIKVARWPGGEISDMFHWQANTGCGGEYLSPNVTFANFMNAVAIPANLDIAVTVNYGSNPACNGGGDPKEAANWVTYAKTHGDPVSHWTVGNEVYTGLGYDLHSPRFNPTTYATAVTTGYYPDIKAANAKALVGVVVGSSTYPTWDQIVLAKAKYDFVETHYYAELAGQESDSYLISEAPQDFTASIVYLKKELAAANHASTPIYVGEIGSVGAHPGIQTSSITQALFAGQVLGEMMNNGISRADWWIGFGICSDATSGNFSSSLYGWQNFGGYMVFSDAIPEYGCANATPTSLGTPLPTARAFQLFSLVANNGEHALGVTVGDSTGNLRAYALTHGGGTALVLFNLNQTATLPVTLAVTGVGQSSAVTVDIYDRAIYDQSQSNVWAPPTETALGAQSLPLSLTLQPWSMNVVRLAP